MSKSVAICIPNRNAFEMIELCIESILYYTKYPNYKIIVFDDFSYLPSVNKEPRLPASDISYLRKCRDEGLLELHENSGPPLTHGGSLNRLLHEYAKDYDYVAILDNDIQIKGYNWLADLVNIAESNPKTLAVVDSKIGGFARWAYRTPIHLWWFGLLNMQAYQDGMKVDWKLCKTDRREWPYSKEFEDFYPPENCKWTWYFESAEHIRKEDFDVNVVCNDPGAKLCMKVKYENPKGYRVLPIPPSLFQKYHHFGHLSMISVPSPFHEPAVGKAREERYERVREELGKMRERTSKAS